MAIDLQAAIQLFPVLIVVTAGLTTLVCHRVFKDDSFRDHVIGGIAIHAFVMMIAAVMIILIWRTQ